MHPKSSDTLAHFCLIFWHERRLKFNKLAVVSNTFSYVRKLTDVHVHYYTHGHHSAIFGPVRETTVDCWKCEFASTQSALTALSR